MLLKQDLRFTLSRQRRALSLLQVSLFSAAIVEQLQHLPIYQQAKRIMLYYPIHNEVDLLALVRSSEAQGQDKEFFLPVTLDQDIEIRRYSSATPMVSGQFGIPEPQGPAYTESLDLILIPAVGFDTQHHRLGRGGGYYDRFLSQLSQSTPTIGVAYDFQVVSQIPVERHDQPVMMVVTPTRVL